MKLPHGWSASFLDGPQRVVLRKPGANRDRTVYLQWSNPFLKSVDPVSGVLLTGLTTSLPDDVRQPLLRAARERWA